jgi:hypothetical protein
MNPGQIVWDLLTNSPQHVNHPKNPEMTDSLKQNPPLSLCSPAPDLTCFGCCPPIRPAHYDCLEYVGSLRREFVENRRLFMEQGPKFRPIVGYHCWALGFLDPRGRTVGCLLHPNRNEGKDLRSLVDYGDKCRRENCLPARVFAKLPPGAQRFWLPLARGLSPFHFSSRRSNPLFHLLLWGPEILEPMRLQAEARGWTETELLSHCPFLTDTNWAPRAHRYLFRVIMEWKGVQKSLEPTLQKYAVELRKRIRMLAEATLTAREDPPYGFTHDLPLESDFLDLLRLELKWQRISLEGAQSFKRKVESLLQYT